MAAGKNLEVQIEEQENDHSYYDRVIQYTTTPRYIGPSNENDNNNSNLRTLITRNIHKKYKSELPPLNVVEVKSGDEGEPEIHFNRDGSSYPLLDYSLFTQCEDFLGNVMLPIGAISTGNYIWEPLLTRAQVMPLNSQEARLQGLLRYGCNDNRGYSFLMPVNVDIEFMNDRSVRVNRIYIGESVHPEPEENFELIFDHNEEEGNSELSSDQMISSYQEDEDDKLPEATGIDPTPDNLIDNVNQLNIDPATIYSLFSNIEKP